MRCIINLSFMMVVSVPFALPVTAQTADQPPRKLRRPLEVLSLDDKPQAIAVSATEDSAKKPNRIPSTTLPQVSPDGVPQQVGVSQRLRNMRRQAVDIDLSRSFFTAPNDPTTSHGKLPEVPKRKAGKPKPPVAEPVATAPPVQQESAGPEPTPARRTPVPAVRNQTLIATRPLGDSSPAVRRDVPTESPAVDAPRFVDSRPADPVVVDNSSDVLLTNTAPAITFETTGPRTIIIGQRSDYTVRIINVGRVDAKNVMVNVKMPAWAEVNSTSASQGAAVADSSNGADSKVTWEIERLAAGASETLSLGLIPRDSRPIDLAVGWSFAPKHSSAQIVVQEPMLRMDIHGPSEVRFGETATFTVTLSNPGTGDASNVVLNLMPTSQQRVAGSREIGVLKAGERKSVDIELTAHRAGRLKVRAMAQARGGLRDEANQEVVVRRANLEMAVMGPPRNYAASVAVYKVRIENVGDAVAENAMAVATLPAGASFLSGSDGATYDPERGQVTWRVGTLQPSVARVLEMNCELHTSGENRMDVHCEADMDLSVAKSVTTHVEALADLKLYVNDPKGAIAVGESSVYEVRVENRGTKAAEMVQVVGYFSDGIEPTTIRGVRGDVATGQVVLDPIDSIAAGQQVVFQIYAKASRPGNHVFRAELQCSTPETRLAAEEWTKYYGNGDVMQAAAPTEGSEQLYDLGNR